MLEGFQPTVLKTFGGLCTYIDRIALPMGLSPDCKNVRFAPGMVATRDGYGVHLTDDHHPLTGVSQLVRANGDRHTIILTSDGTLKVEYPDGTLTARATGINTPSLMKSCSLFSTKYICFNDGRLGTMPMHRYDGKTVSLVGAGAPGKAPVIAESTNAATGGVGLTAGTHSCAVIFVNAAGDKSGWSPVHSAVFAASTKKTLVTVPLGPPGTVQRIVAITPRNDPGTFAYTPKTIVNENTTATAIEFDISEQDLLTSQLTITRRVSGFVPWLPAGCFSHQERVIVWGARDTLEPGVMSDAAISTVTLQNIGLRNLAFDGGFDATNVTPNGWTTAAGADGAGGTAGGDSGSPFEGKLYRITGDASSLVRGKLTQTVTNNSNYLRPQARYGVSIIMRSPYGTTGDIHIELKGASTTFLSATFPAGLDADSGYMTAIAEMPANLTVDEKTLTATIFWQGAAGMGVGKWVEFGFGIYDADDTQYLHTIYASDVGYPGTFTGETCVMSIGPDDGEGIRNIFKLRDVLYTAKERSLYSLVSSTQGEPSEWSVDIVDPFAGTPSSHGVVIGNGFALIASRNHLFLFDGASARPVSREIQGVWRAADWSRGHCIVMVLDPSKEVVRIALPMAGDSYGASKLLTLDYKDGWGSAVEGNLGMKWSIDELETDTEVLAGTLIVNRNGIHVPVFAVISGPITNTISNSRDFSGSTWAISPSTSITGSQADGRSGAYATQWAWDGTALVAVRELPSGTGASATISFRAMNEGIDDLVITLSSDAYFGSYTVTLPAGEWTRVVGTFHDTVTPRPTLPVIIVSVAATDGSTASMRLADMSVVYNDERVDLGFADTGAGATGGNLCSLVISPVDGLRRDFAGRIRFRYATALFGAEVGRSKYDRCVIRAQGDGFLNASYLGLGTRSWDMTPVQLVEAPDEDLEYGANMSAPGASLVLTNTSVDGWAVLNIAVVAAKGEQIGWLRGRNG